MNSGWTAVILPFNGRAVGLFRLRGCRCLQNMDYLLLLGQEWVYSSCFWSNCGQLTTIVEDEAKELGIDSFVLEDHGEETPPDNLKDACTEKGKRADRPSDYFTFLKLETNDCDLTLTQAVDLSLSVQALIDFARHYWWFQQASSNVPYSVGVYKS
jgi:hypothetical protein